MAKKVKEENKEVKKSVASFFSTLKKETGAEAFNKSKLTKVDHYVDTGCYALNRICSGSIYGGLPGGAVILFSGESATSKTLSTFIAAKNAIEKNGYGAIIYVDTEGGANRGMLESVGINMDLVQYVPVATVEEATVKLITIYKTIASYQEQDPDFKAMVILDSLGGLVSEKVLLDAAKDKSVADMGALQKKCLAGDTLVLMSDGNLKPLKDIKIGDTVITHLNKIKMVIDAFSSKHNGYYNIKVNGQNIKCSAEHKFLIKRDNKFQYIQAKDLKITDKLISLINS